jgi:putative methyltransferase (TIGR04325 family)
MVKRIPAVRTHIQARLYRRFLSSEGFATYYGAYGSFAEARANLPASREFDSADVVADLMDTRLHRVYPYDYPVVHWLGQAFLGGATRVFDLGGSVGVHYHAYHRILPYPEGLQWEVCEVPAAAALGRQTAARLGARGLTFVDRLEPGAVRAHVWISAGALQYIEDAPLDRLLGASPAPPDHVILNKLPLYDGDDFVVTQNIGPGVYAPAYVYNRARFLEQVNGAGYELVDAWEVPERSFYLPGHPERCFPSFSGLYFRRSAALAARP